MISLIICSFLPIELTKRNATYHHKQRRLSVVIIEKATAHWLIYQPTYQIRFVTALEFSELFFFKTPYLIFPVSELKDRFWMINHYKLHIECNQQLIKLYDVPFRLVYLYAQSSSVLVIATFQWSVASQMMFVNMF